MKTRFRPYLFLCIPAAALFAGLLVWPGPVSAYPGGSHAVEMVVNLNELRDTLTKNWITILKYGWEARIVIDEPNGLKSIEQIIGKLEKLSVGTRSDAKAKTAELLHTVKRIGPAEQKYLLTISRTLESAYDPMLISTDMAMIGGFVTAQTNAIVYGVQPPGSTEKSNRLSGIEERPASSDPEEIRAAYEAFQLSSVLNYQLLNISNEVLLAMYVETWPTPVHFKPNPQSQERAMKAIMRLPGLTDRQKKNVGDIPILFQRTVDSIADFEKCFYQKKLDQAELEDLVKSALSLIDELRNLYLESLEDL